MNSPVLEYTSHLFPTVTRVQYEGLFATKAGFVFTDSDVEMPSAQLWCLLDEAVSQNARLYKPKPTHFFIFQFDTNKNCISFEIKFISDDELKIRKRRFPPHRLRKEAYQLAKRRFPESLRQKAELR